MKFLSVSFLIYKKRNVWAENIIKAKYNFSLLILKSKQINAKNVNTCSMLYLENTYKYFLKLKVISFVSYLCFIIVIKKFNIYSFYELLNNHNLKYLKVNFCDFKKSTILKNFIKKNFNTKIQRITYKFW